MHCLGAHSTNTVSIEFHFNYIGMFIFSIEIVPIHIYVQNIIVIRPVLVELGYLMEFGFHGKYLSGMGDDGRFLSAIRRIFHRPLARYVRLRIAHAPEMPETFSPPLRVSDPDMHHSTCVTHVPWCMPGSLTSGFLWIRQQGKTFPAFPAHAQPAILLIR